jgi:hypothetical protein
MEVLLSIMLLLACFWRQEGMLRQGRILYLQFLQMEPKIGEQNMCYNKDYGE